jgi:crossover junction endodeoxyribonuclease RusA
MLILKGNPKSNQHIYLNRGHIKFMKKEAKGLKADYIRQLKEQWEGDIIDWEIEIAVRLYFGDRRKRDWDNFSKLTMDAMTGVVFEDDSQIKKATVELFYCKENPRTEIKIMPYFSEVKPK